MLIGMFTMNATNLTGPIEQNPIVVHVAGVNLEV